MNTVASPTVVGDLRRGWSLRSIWGLMAWSDIVARYRRSVLGPFWVAGSMVATSISLAVVFGSIFNQPLREVMPYIMAGLVTWQMAALFLVEGPDLFLSQAGTIQNNALPTSFYILRFAARAFITFAHNLIVLGLSFLATGYLAGISWQVLPGLLLLTVFVIFSSGVAGLISARFRDMRFLMPQIGQLLFFLTPVFWRADTLTDERAVIYLYNPMYYMLVIIRDPLLGKSLPLQTWGVAATIVAVTIVAYLLLFARFRRRLPFWL